MPPEVSNTPDKPTETKDSAFHKLCNEAYDIAKEIGHGFGHEVVKPLVGTAQIVTGQTGNEIDPKTPEQSTVGYMVGSFAGQATDFLAVQVLAKKIGVTPKLTGIIASGVLGSLNTTESGGHTLASVEERLQNFAVGAGSMAAYEGGSTGLRKAGLNQGLGKGLLREATAGLGAGLVSAQSNSLLKKHEFADATTTAEAMIGWAAMGSAFHLGGAGLGKLSAELKPEFLIRAGKLEPTATTEGGPTREFIMTSGKEKVDAFKASNERGTTVTVRELLKGDDGSVSLGSRQNMLVQHLSSTEGDGRLLPAAQKADLIATCHPENLTVTTRAKHVFANQEGNVWMFTGKDNRLLLSSGDVPINVTNVNGYKEPFKLNRGDTTIYAMAPLLVGNPNDMDSDESKAAMADFRRQLKEAKALKMDGISMDMWWGMFNKEKGKFDFSYPQLLVNEVKAAGLDVAAVLSFHKCGGNVGDTENIPIPEWVWKDLADKFGTTDLNVGKFKSEQGHYSDEYIQGWADKHAINYYADAMAAFRDHFRDQAPFISEVNISLGPSGEMRYPSYNSHDVGTGYPTRGGFQGYSDLAKIDFREWTLQKYGSAQAAGNAWNIKDLTNDRINPPDDANSFFDQNNQSNTQYGKDLVDWYNQSLVAHGKRVMTQATQIFGAADSPFLGTPIGAKVPGVHWRMGWRDGNNVYFSDRKAEINAGLITTSSPWTEDNAYGYQNILNMMKELQPAGKGVGSPVIPSYTCLELPDGQDGPDAQSLPHTAATRFGIAAKRMGLLLRGENALSGTLYNGADWDLMDDQVVTSLQPGRFYNGLTLLRLHDVVDNPVAREKVSGLIKAIHADQVNWQTLAPEALKAAKQPMQQPVREPAMAGQ